MKTKDKSVKGTEKQKENDFLRNRRGNREGSEQSSKKRPRQWCSLKKTKKSTNARKKRRTLDRTHQKEHEKSRRSHEKDENTTLDWNAQKAEVEDGNENCVSPTRTVDKQDYWEEPWSGQQDHNKQISWKTTTKMERRHQWISDDRRSKRSERKRKKMKEWKTKQEKFVKKQDNSNFGCGWAKHMVKRFLPSPFPFRFVCLPCCAGPFQTFPPSRLCMSVSMWCELGLKDRHPKQEIEKLLEQVFHRIYALHEALRDDCELALRVHHGRDLHRYMALHDHWWTWVLRLPEGARAWGDQRFYHGSDLHGHVALHDHWCTRVQQLCRGRDHLDAPDQHRCCRLLRLALPRVRQRALCYRRLREQYQQREHHRRVPLQRYLPEPRDEVSRLSFRNKSFRFLFLGKGEKAKSSNTKPKTKKESKLLITPRSSKHYQRQSSKTRSPSTEWTRFQTTACTKISATACTKRYYCSAENQFERFRWGFGIS